MVRCSHSLGPIHIAGRILPICRLIHVNEMNKYKGNSDTSLQIEDFEDLLAIS